MLCHSVGMLVCHTRSMYAGSWMQVCSFHLGSLHMYMHVLLAYVCVCFCTPAHAGKGQRFDQEASMPLPQLQQPMPALRSSACASANACSDFHLFLSKSIACALLGLSYPFVLDVDFARAPLACEMFGFPAPFGVLGQQLRHAAEQVHLEW